MRSLSLPAWLYPGGLWAAAGAAALLALVPWGWAPPWAVLAALPGALLAALLGRVRILTPVGAAVSCGALVTLTVLLTAGPAAALVAGLLPVAAQEGGPWRRRWVPMAATALAVAAAAAARAVGGAAGGAHPWPADLAAAGAYLAVEALVTAGAVAGGGRLLATLRYLVPVRVLAWPFLAAVLAPAVRSAPAVGVPLLLLACAGAYRAARAEAAVRAAVERDPLTGLFRRAFLAERLEELLRETDPGPVAVVLLHLRGLGTARDRYGPAAGDQVLRRLGEMLAERVRWPHLAARWGEDEVALVLTGPRAGEAEDLCRALARDLVAAGLPAPPAGCRWGVAVTPPAGRDAAGLLSLAAAALTEVRGQVAGGPAAWPDRLEQTGALDLLPAGVAHEVRNSLAAVRGFIQLEGHRLDPEVYGLVLSELDRSAALCAELSRLARPTPPDRVPFDPAEVLAAAGRLGQVLARQYAGRLVLAVPPDLPRITGDPIRLRQVLLNLMQNAFESAPGVTVTLTAGTGRRDLWIRVEDDGPGVPPGLREQIFAPFYTTKPGGTGLGLSISRHLVHAMGGALTCEPAAGGRFVIRLPLAE